MECPWAGMAWAVLAKTGGKGAATEELPARKPDSRDGGHPPISLAPRRKAGGRIGCALDYAALGGGTGGRSARGVPPVGPDGKIIGSDGGAIAMSRRSQSKSTFTFSGDFSGCRSFCFPSVMRLQRSHGRSPPSVVCTAVAKESVCVRSIIIRVHATDCSNAQCPPTLASNARITMRRLALRRTMATGAVLLGAAVRVKRGHHFAGSAGFGGAGLRAGFGSRFAARSSSVIFDATPPDGTSAFALHTIAFSTSFRWFSFPHPL